MTLTLSFKKAQSNNPSWSYMKLAEFLKCDVATLRGMNNRLKLPIPTRSKALNGQAKPRDRKKKDKPQLPPQIKPQVNRVASKCGPIQTGYTRLY